MPTKSEAARELEGWLRGVVLLGGEGLIDLGGRGPVYVAVVHDGSGFNPGAAIAVDQNPYHDLSNDVLETAFEIMKEDALKNEEHVREIQEEWGDRWEEILTEAFDGRVWRIADPAEAAAAIRSDRRASKFVEIEEAGAESLSGPRRRMGDLVARAGVPKRVLDRNGVEIAPGQRVRVVWPYYYLNVREDEGVVKRIDEYAGVTIGTDHPVPHHDRSGAVVHEEPWIYFPSEYDYKRGVHVAAGGVGDPFEHGRTETYIEVIGDKGPTGRGARGTGP